MSFFKKYDIYLARVPYLDKPGTYKIRPVVIIDNELLVVFALKVSSKIGQIHSKAYFLEDWKSDGLVKPSIVLVEKVYPIDIDDIYHKIGSLSTKEARDIGILAKEANS